MRQFKYSVSDREKFLKEMRTLSSELTVLDNDQQQTRKGLALAYVEQQNFELEGATNSNHPWALNRKRFYELRKKYNEKKVEDEIRGPRKW